MNPKHGLNSDEILRVTTMDLGGGPFLAIEPVYSGDNMSEPPINEHVFFLETEDQVDRLAATLKAILRQVNATG